MIGSDAALFLAEQGKKVTITTRGSAIGRGLSNRARGDFFTRMSRQDIDVRTGVYLEEITDHGVITSAEDGAKYEIECDSVIPASGLVPNRQLFNELVDTGGVSQLFAVGDCVVPRTILEAVHEGYVVANNI